MDQLHPLTIALGAGNFGALTTVILLMLRLERRVTYWMIEHEMMLQDFCERKGIPVTSLPTRVRVR